MSVAAGIPHGTRNTYEYYGCRCQDCRDAEAVYRKAARRAGGKSAIRYWPTARATYVCACGFTAEVSGSWTFERVEHTCY